MSLYDIPLREVTRTRNEDKWKIVDATITIISFKHTISFEIDCKKNVMRWVFHDTQKMVENTQECFQRCNFVRTISAITTDKNPISISIYRNEWEDLFPLWNIYFLWLHDMNISTHAHKKQSQNVVILFCAFNIHIYFTFYHGFYFKAYLFPWRKSSQSFHKFKSWDFDIEKLFFEFELNLMHFMMVVACDDHDDAISFYFIFQWYCISLYSMHCLFKATELTKAFLQMSWLYLR